MNHPNFYSYLAPYKKVTREVPSFTEDIWPDAQRSMIKAILMNYRDMVRVEEQLTKSGVKTRRFAWLRYLIDIS